MKELLTYIVQSLVEKPDEVSVTEHETGGETVFEVRVAPGDMGKVIGRQGRVVKEIRVLMKAVAQRQGDVVRGANFADFAEVLVEEVFLMMGEAPFRHNRTAA